MSRLITDIRNQTHPQESTGTTTVRNPGGADSHADVAPPVRATDQVVGGSSNVVPASENPFAHMQVAQVALAELKADADKNLNDTDKVTYTDERGTQHSVDWKTRREQLQAIVHDESVLAMNVADSLKQTGPDSVAEKIAAFMKDQEPERVRLATQFGYDPKNVDEQALATKLSTMDQNDPQYAALAKLSQLQQDGDTLHMLSAAPSVARMAYANYLQMGALDNPDKPGFTAADNATSAFQLSRESARLDKGNAVMGAYGDEIARINQRFEELQTDRCRAVSQEIEAASKATTPDAKDKAYQQAMELAKGIDVTFLTGLLKDPRNAQNDSVRAGLIAQIVTVDNAAAEYGKFLSDQGKYDQAAPLLVKAMADFPELFQNDPSFNKAMNVCMVGKDNVDKNPAVELTAFNKSMSDSKYTDAAAHLAATKKIAQDELAVMQKDQQAMATQRTAIQAQIAALDKDTLHNDDEKNATKLRLQQELASFDAFDANAKQKQNLVGHCTYLEGYLAYVNGDNAAARTAIADFKNNYPDLAKSPDYKLADLEDEIRDRGAIGNFIHRNKANIIKYVCIGAGVVAGIAAAAATFYLGPGALVAGGAAGAAVTAGVAVLMGAGAGSLAYTGASLATPTLVAGADGFFSRDGAHKTGQEMSEAWKNTHITSRTWLEGAGYGAAGAAAYVTGGWLAEAFPAAGASGMTGQLLTMLPKFGSGLAYGVVAHGSDESIQMAYDHKDGGRALHDFAVGTAVDTAFFTILPGGRALGPGTAFRDAMMSNGVDSGYRAVFNGTVWKQALSTGAQAALKPHEVKLSTPTFGGRVPALSGGFRVPTFASNLGHLSLDWGVVRGPAPEYILPMAINSTPLRGVYLKWTGTENADRVSRDENPNLNMPDAPPDLDALPSGQTDQQQ
jgi:hypothetical protein